MSWAFLAILFAACLALIAMGLRTRGGVLEFPFLAGTTFAGFVLPQMPALSADPHLPAGAFEQTAVFTTLCALAVGLGWAAGRRPFAALHWQLDPRKTVWLAAVLSVAGSVFYYKLSALPKEVMDTTLLSGVPVAYLFFAKLLSYGLYLAVLCRFKWRSRLALAVAAFGAALLLHRIVIGGRRGELTEFVLVTLLAAWFTRRQAVPRALVLVAALAAGLALNSTGAYRAAAGAKDGPNLAALTEIDVLGNFDRLLRDGGPEMRNALFRIHDADELMAFDFGLFHWNVLVFNFVPAQLVGTSVKQGLLAPVPVQSGREYLPPTGSTETGMADAFASFWYLGCAKFFLIAYVLGRLYRGAMLGSMPSQIAYAVSVVPAMLAITHHTQWVLSTWVNMAILLLPGLVLARAAAGRIEGGITLRQGRMRRNARQGGPPKTATVAQLKSQGHPG